VTNGGRKPAVSRCRAVTVTPFRHRAAKKTGLIFRFTVTWQRAMGDIVIKPRGKTRTKTAPKTERPRLHKVILVNDDYTPRDFVVSVLKAEFRMTEDQAYKVMLTAHQRGVCVVAVFTKDVAETKATRATDAGRAKGYPLLFTTEPEE
jgi:ATP-dependent Clp protease adaptor protein ClpS